MLLALAAIVVVGGCKKKQVPPAPPAAPPPAAQPKATLSVNPESIDRGGSATLTWSTQDATTVTIDGIGGVQPNGSQQVSPSTSTTYHLTATGPGGSTDATARLTVVQPPAPPPTPQAAVPQPDEATLFSQSVKDIYFDYDSYDLTSGDQAIVNADAAFLKAHPSIKFTIEGHCDERGSTDYNLALGDNRANAARDALVKAGVAASRSRSSATARKNRSALRATRSAGSRIVAITSFTANSKPGIA